MWTASTSRLSLGFLLLRCAGSVAAFAFSSDAVTELRPAVTLLCRPFGSLEKPQLTDCWSQRSALRVRVRCPEADGVLVPSKANCALMCFPHVSHEGRDVFGPTSCDHRLLRQFRGHVVERLGEVHGRPHTHRQGPSTLC